MNPAAAKILLLADGDSRIAWVARLGALLGQALYGRPDCTVFLPGNSVQACAALFRHKQLDISTFDLVLLGFGGGANLRFSNAFARFFHHTTATRRPLLLAGFNGICDADDPHALFVRTGADLILANCTADLEKFERWLAATGCTTATELLGYVRHTETTPSPPPSSTPPCLLFIAQPGVPASLKERLYILQTLNALAQQHPDWLIKLKPRSSTQGDGVTHPEHYYYQDIARVFLKKWPPNLCFVDAPIAELLTTTTVCATLGSTVAVDAIGRGISTVIAADFGVRRDYGNHHFIGSGCLAPLKNLNLQQLTHHTDPDWQRRHIAFADENIDRIATRLSATLHEQTLSHRPLPLPQPVYTARDHPYMTQDQLRPQPGFWQGHYFFHQAPAVVTAQITLCADCCFIWKSFMSKLTKFFKHPVLFFSDASKKKNAAKNKTAGTEQPVEIKKVAPSAAAKTAVPAPATTSPQPKEPTKVNPPKTVAKPKEAAVLRPQSFYLEKVLDFKQSNAVNTLKYKDYSLWPAFRSELMIQCDIAWKKNIQNEIAFNPYQSQLCRSANISFERGEELAANFDFFRHVDDLKEENIDFLFFSNLNSTDQVEVAGKIYNRLIDPLYESAKKIGSARKVEIIKAASPAISKIRNYHNIPDCIIPPCVYKYGFSDAVKFPRKFMHNLKQKIPFIGFSEERINSFFDWHLHMLDFYRTLLAKYNPKVVFFHPFYYYTPLIAAARERGIKTVDIQHGVMIGYNSVFYDNWQETPQSGYQALPDYFLVWSELEAQHLEHVFAHATGEFPHRTLVSGYPWLDYELTMDKKTQSQLREIADFVKSGEKSVLVTLQRDSLIPKNVEAIIASSGDDVRWLIRRHPKGAEFMSPVKKLKNVLFGDEVDRVELRDLFKLVDYNFTDGSSTVLEADYFGVYSFVYGNEGVMNYKDLIDAGRVGLIPDTMSKYEELHLGEEDRQAKIGYFQRVDISALLEKMLRRD